MEDGSACALAKAYDPAVAWALLGLCEARARSLARLAWARGPIELVSGAATATVGATDGGRGGGGGGGSGGSYGLRVRAAHGMGALAPDEARKLLDWVGSESVGRSLLLHAKRTAACARTGAGTYHVGAQKLPRAPPAGVAADAADRGPRHVWVDMRQVQMLAIDVLHAQLEDKGTVAYELLAQLSAAGEQY